MTLGKRCALSLLIRRRVPSAQMSTLLRLPFALPLFLRPPPPVTLSALTRPDNLNHDSLRDTLGSRRQPLVHGHPPSGLGLAVGLSHPTVSSPGGNSRPPAAASFHRQPIDQLSPRLDPERYNLHRLLRHLLFCYVDEHACDQRPALHPQYPFSAEFHLRLRLDVLRLLPLCCPLQKSLGRSPLENINVLVVSSGSCYF